MMKQYDSYKDSGVEWIGKIPSHWKMTKLKFLTSCNDEVLTENTPNDYNIQYVEIGDVSSVEGIKNITEYDFKSAPSRARRITRIGDVIISTVRTYLKAITRIERGDLIVSTGFAVLRPQNIYENFLGFAVLSEKFMSEVVSKSDGVSYPAINSTALINIKVPTPTYEEQVSISNVLKNKCDEIDKAIATQEKRVELLKELRQNIITQAVTRGINPNAPLKDSGVEWIGDIPEHWEMKRIKHVCKINGRVGYRGYTTADLVSEGEGAYTIGGKHISTNVLDLSDADYISWEKYYESPEIMVKKGDIVTAQRGSLGKTAIVREEIGEATINPSLVLLNHISIYNEFLYWYLVSTPTQIAIELLNTSTAVPMVSQWQISNINIPIPPLSEQQEIVSYIESQTARLDTSIEKAEHQIELLQELKQSIITEVVTGKRKVD